MTGAADHEIADPFSTAGGSLMASLRIEIHRRMIRGLAIEGIEQQDGGNV